MTQSSHAFKPYCSDRYQEIFRITGIRIELLTISLSLFVVSFAILAAARKYMRLREKRE